MAAQGIDELLIQIAATIYNNTEGDIEGDILKTQLTDMVDSLNQGLWSAAVPYNIGQTVVYNDSGTLGHYQCVADADANEDPINFTGKWDLVTTTGVGLNEIVTTKQALRDVTGYSDEELALVNENNYLYQFDAVDTQADDDDLVIKPTDSGNGGRWLRVSTYVTTDTTGSVSSLITTTQANLVAAINEVSLWGVEEVDNITGLENIASDRRAIKIVTVKWYDETTPGAGSGGVRRTLFYKGPDFTNTEWEDLANWQQLEPIVTTGFTTTVTVGGVDAATVYTVGTTLESIIKAILAPYVPPVISSFSVTTSVAGPTYEVGEAVNLTDATIGVTNDSEGDPPATLYISGTGYNKAANVGSTLPTGNPLAIGQTTNTTLTWEASGTDANTDPINTPSTTRSWYFSHNVGANSTVLTGANISAEGQAVVDALQLQNLVSGKAQTITCTAPFDVLGNYTYIAYADKFGALSSILLNGPTEVIGAFTEVGTFTYTNTEAHDETYRVYKSNSDKAFASGDQLAIT